MDTNNTGDTQNIQKFPKANVPINDNILNTPPIEDKNVQKTLPDRSRETFFEMNKPKGFQPQQDVVLDIDGQKAPIKDTGSPDVKLESVQKMIYGDDAVADKPANTGAILIFAGVVIALITVVIFSQKRTDYILRLEKEINALKKDKISEL